jgi:hypothetical protein
MSEWYVVSREPAPGQAGSGISENLAQFANESLAKEFARRIYLEGKFIEARGPRHKFDRTNVADWLAAK